MFISCSLWFGVIGLKRCQLLYSSVAKRRKLKVLSRLMLQEVYGGDNSMQWTQIALFMNIKTALHNQLPINFYSSLTSDRAFWIIYIKERTIIRNIYQEAR